jgi:hypothetical protein
MLKTPAEYDRDISPEKLTDIPSQVSPYFATKVSLLVVARYMWWMNQD